MDRNNLTRAQWFEEVILLTEMLNDEIRNDSRDIEELCCEPEIRTLTVKIDIDGATFYFLEFQVGCFSESERLNPDRIAYRIRRSITRYARIISDLDRFSERNSKANHPNVIFVDEFPGDPGFYGSDLDDDLDCDYID